MNKKKIIFLSLSLILVIALTSCVTQSPKHEKPYRIGILSGLDFFSVIADSFKEEMANSGYVEGKNVVYDIHKTNFEPEKEKQILEKFVADNVDLILVFPTEVSLAAKKVTQGTDIPVIFASAFIEETGLIDSIGQPGGNITGVRYPGTDVAIKRLEILHQIMPKAERVWLPYQKGYPSVPLLLDILRPAAESLEITLIEFPATDLAHLQSELASRAESDNFDFDAVLYIPESLSTSPATFTAIAEFTEERRIPIMGTKIITEDSGTVFGVTTNNPDFGKLAAPIADKILRGVPAGTIPVVSPEPYLIFNYIVAKNFSIELPEGLLAQADEIIH